VNELTISRQAPSLDALLLAGLVVAELAVEVRKREKIRFVMGEALRAERMNFMQGQDILPSLRTSDEWTLGPFALSRPRIPLD
jgi:hypothetical protein